MKLSFFLALMGFSIFGHASEAMRYAKHGCEVERAEVSCRIYKRLLNLGSSKKNLPIRSIASENTLGLKLTSTITVSKSAMEKRGEDCSDFPSKLATCTPYRCSYLHPMFGGEMKREIIGAEGEACKTTEEMPNNGSMSCSFPKIDLSTVISFYKSDGKENASYLNRALGNGICTVTGY